MVVNTYNSSTWEAERGGLVEFKMKPGLYSEFWIRLSCEILSQNKTPPRPL